MDVLQSALESQFNFFFFDYYDDEGFLRAPFSSIGSLLKLPAEKYGEPRERLPFKGRGRAAEEQCEDFAVDDASVQLDDHFNDEDEVVIEEVGHVPSLQEYYDLDIDRRPGALSLSRFISDLKDGKDLGGGWFQLDVSYYTKHGIPGRLIAYGASSLSQLTREAISVAINGRCVDLDFPISHLASLVAILESLGV